MRAAIEKALSGHPVAKWALTSWGCVQFLCVVPDSVLDDDGRFRQQVAAVNALGDLAIAAVQRAFGGFTGEQQRVLAGWRGRNDEIEAMLTSVASEVGGKILSHGWDPRHESLPLLVVEEKVPGGWANRFATVDATGMVRLRTTVPVSQDGERGHSLTITWVEPEPAKTWARRLGVGDRPGPLTVDDLSSLAGRPWHELTEALHGLRAGASESWQPATSK